MIETLQQEAFGEGIKIIRTPSPKGSTPFMNQLYLMIRAERSVVVSRITETEVEDSVKFPVLLPTKHRVPNGIVEESHSIK